MANPLADDPATPDLYWAGPSGWAMLPIAIVVGGASGLSWFGVPYFAEWLGLDHEWTMFLLFQAILLTWLVLALHWGYRAACVVARLTPQRIYLDYGMLYRPTPPIELVSIHEVRCSQGPLGRLFHVGTVTITTKTQRRVRFVGLHHPHAFADAIQQAMHQGATS